MLFKNLKRFIHISAVCGGLCLILLLTACRSIETTVRIDAEITPAPIVGEIVTLHIETLSPKEGGEGVFALYYNEEINFLDVAPEWYEPTEDRGAKSLEWRGPVVAGEPIVHEFKLCVSEPGFSGIYIETLVAGKYIGEYQVNIYSTTDFAEIDPRSRYRQPPAGSTPTPTPEPVRVSPECAGENL